MNTGRAFLCLMSFSILAILSAAAAGANSSVDLAIKAGLRPDPAVSVPPQEPRVPTKRHDVVVIDFEDFSLGGNLFLDTAETLVFPNVGGSGVTVTIEGHDDVRIYDLYLYAGNYGTSRQALIDMDWVEFSNPLGTTINFDPPVNNVGLLAGDYGSDDDSPLTITAFDGNGSVIGTDSKSWSIDKFPPFAQLSVPGAGIKTLHYLSGGAYPSSTFIDDLSFTPAATPTMATSWGRLKSLYR